MNHFSIMKRARFILGFLISATLVFSLLSLRPDQAWARKKKKFKGVIIVNQLLKLDGTATNNGNPAAEYSAIHQGDVLETGAKSRAVVRIPGLAVFRLGPNTKVKFAKFNDRNVTQIDLLKGELLSLYRRTGDHELLFNHSHLQLHSSATLFAVSTPSDGARADAASTPDGAGTEDKICVCDGKIDIAALDPAPHSELVARRHQNHPTNEELAAIAASKGASISALPTATPTAAIGKKDAKAASSPAASDDLKTPITSLNAEPPASAPAIPQATATAASTAAPLPHETQVISEMAHKECDVSDKGTEIKASSTLLGLHSDREIKDLESLYALP